MTLDRNKVAQRNASITIRLILEIESLHFGVINRLNYLVHTCYCVLHIKTDARRRRPRVPRLIN